MSYFHIVTLKYASGPDDHIVLESESTSCKKAAEYVETGMRENDETMPESFTAKKVGKREAWHALDYARDWTIDGMATFRG